MKTQVTIPDELYQEAERLAEELDTSRDELYERALKAFLRSRQGSEITARLNRIEDELDEPVDPFLKEAARRLFRASER